MIPGHIQLYSYCLLLRKCRAHLFETNQRIFVVQPHSRMLQEVVEQPPKFQTFPKKQAFPQWKEHVLLCWPQVNLFQRRLFQQQSIIL